MLNQSEMMNHSQMQVLNQLQSQSQQVMNNQHAQMMLMNQTGYGMWQPPIVDQIMLKHQKTKPSGYIPSRNNKNWRKTTSLGELHQQNTESFLTRAGVLPTSLHAANSSQQ